VCAAYAACLRVEALEPGLILNLASGTARRIGDILHDLLALAGVEAAIETGGALLRPSEIPATLGDSSRAAALLGWRPTIEWQTTLRDVLNDWRLRVHDEPS
jgi:GDP-4-dehydro-6-deoxy-D-mannose reductase